MLGVDQASINRHIGWGTKGMLEWYTHREYDQGDKDTAQVLAKGEHLLHVSGAALHAPNLWCECSTMLLSPRGEVT